MEIRNKALVIVNQSNSLIVSRVLEAIDKNEDTKQTMLNETKHRLFQYVDYLRKCATQYEVEYDFYSIESRITRCDVEEIEECMLHLEEFARDMNEFIDQKRTDGVHNF